MKFDVTIANPPYKNKITEQFINKALDISGIVCQIVPVNTESKDNYNIKNNSRLKYIIKNNDIFHNIVSVYTQILLYDKDKVEKGHTYLIDNRDDKRVTGRGKFEFYLRQTPEATEHWNKILETLDKGETSEELKIYKISLLDDCKNYSIENLMPKKKLVDSRPFIEIYKENLEEYTKNTFKEIDLWQQFALDLMGLYLDSEYVMAERQARVDVIKHELSLLVNDSIDEIYDYILKLKTDRKGGTNL